MKILLTGEGGQLAGAVSRSSLARADEITALDCFDLDVTRREQVDDAVDGLRPDLVINAAAYTAVDRAESERDEAFLVNAVGPENLARASVRAGARLIHISTDFVFDGESPRPYTTDAPARPLSVYGESKLAGESAVLRLAPDSSAVVRTSWLYSAEGANFVTTMLRLFKQRDRVSVVADQVGSPTWAGSLAECIVRVAHDPDLGGILHWADAGVASWYDLAQATLEEGRRLGLVADGVRVLPIGSEEYPTAARRPAYSVLDTRSTSKAIDLEPNHWRTNLVRMLEELNSNDS
jgi:dTDP-4-dehydrorhamnose reductase